MSSIADALCQRRSAQVRQHFELGGFPMKMALVPMLPVRNIGQSVSFYEKLGFSVEQQNDSWGWAMLSCGECRIMIDRSINTQPGAERQSVLYLYPDDIDGYHERVRKSGLAIPDLDTTFYGMTEFRIDDPDGNRLWIGQKRADGISAA